METLIEVLKSCLNVPYLYGGKSPIVGTDRYGIDCSGLVEWGFMSIGFDPPGVNNAQMHFDYFMKNSNSNLSDFKKGVLCFYGKSTTEIRHISFGINDHQIIESGGGDETTTSVEIALKKNACVRIRPFGHRKDLIATLMPFYPDWVLNES